MSVAIIYSGDDTQIAANVKGGGVLPVPATDTALVVTVRDPITTSGNAPSAAAPGTTDSRVQSTAGTNPTSLKASAGNVYSVNVCNTGSGEAWLKFYDTAAAPVPGTTPVKFAFYLQPKSREPLVLAFPLHFATGIAYALIAGTGADADVNPVKANEIQGEITWF